PVLVGDSTPDLYYSLEWDSRADRETRWNAFAADPEGLAAKAVTERAGPLISHLSNLFLAPTSYSAMR
ncbi:MAG: NIPSNAP family protein, partial [Burkholderiales bacterium]|nr:NIPSNAP family protein [Burkholderiales bacterium]